jgi:hypothetical protein
VPDEPDDGPAAALDLALDPRRSRFGGESDGRRGAVREAGRDADAPP